MGRQAIVLSVVALFLTQPSFAAELLVPSQYLTIQAGIDAAINGDTVIIADGTYTGTGNRNIDFKGKAITVRSASGLPENCVIDCQSGMFPGQVYRGFYFHTNEGADSILSGLTIQNGSNGTALGEINAYGGGIYCHGASPVIQSCIITNNIARGGNSPYCAYGGGICCNNGSNAYVVDCDIKGNRAIGKNGDTSICSSGGDAAGGGIYSSEDSNITIERCLISNNAVSGGAGPDPGPCGRSGHTGTGIGGGIVGKVDIINSLIIDNYASTGYANRGGGIYAYSGSAVTNCLVTRNSTSSYDSIDLGRGIYCNGVVAIFNCTVTNNKIINSASPAIYCDGASSIINSILWDNDGNDVTGGSVTYSCTQQNIAGTGNIHSDPLFVSGTLGDYYLSQTSAGQSANSPCVDAGSGCAGRLLGTTTRTDNIADTGIVDMGYHYPVINVVDIDKDGDVDYGDISIMASQWSQTPSAPSADINSDGIVNFLDFAALANNWLAGMDCLPSKAINPLPTNGQTGISTTICLTWTAGNGATSHDVYFGTANPPPFVTDLLITNYQLPTLSYSTVYYWRIDEVNAYGTTTGDVWSFTTEAITLLADDFEADFSKWNISTGWEISLAEKYSGNSSALADSGSGNLTSKDIDTSIYGSVTVSFWYRDHLIDDADNVLLKLYSGSWQSVFELGNTSPEDAWHYYTTTVTGSYLRSNFKVQFAVTALDSGEYLYIDDLKVTAQ